MRFITGAAYPVNFDTGQKNLKLKRLYMPGYSCERSGKDYIYPWLPVTFVPKISKNIVVSIDKRAWAWYNAAA